MTAVDGGVDEALKEKTVQDLMNEQRRARNQDATPA
jgi:hypothetical protein